MANVIFQQALHEDADFVAYLEELGFQRIVLGKRRERFGGKFALFVQVMGSSFRLLGRLRSQRKFGTVVAIGHFAFAVKVLARLRVLRYERLFCSGFFVRSPRWFPLFRLLSKLDTSKDHYLIFSRCELPLYAENMGIDPARLHYIPCGDWHEWPAENWLKSADIADSSLPHGDYYFSGGYSNRDYISLIEVFRKIQAPLLIVCSKLNTEIEEARLPANVRVVRDVPSARFDEYISHAKAGIVPLKYGTGSSGQTVVLRLMLYAKPIVVSDVGAVRDYVEPGVSSYLVRDLAAELPAVIATIEANSDAAAKVGQAAQVRYQGMFSRAVLCQRFREILQETDSRAVA
jgi:glycosyltransferase involved in cell wall biosynthesis